MPSYARTFVALSIPVLQRTRLGRLQGLIAPELPGSPVGRTEDVPPDPGLPRRGPRHRPGPRLPGRERVGRPEIRALHPQSAKSLGAFPDAENPRDDLGRRRRAGARHLDGRFETPSPWPSPDVGYPTDDDGYHPHLTIGRLKVGKGDPLDLVKQVPHFKTWSAGNFEVAEVGTYASTLTPEGPAHMGLASRPAPEAENRPGRLT